MPIRPTFQASGLIAHERTELVLDKNMVSPSIAYRAGQRVGRNVAALGRLERKLLGGLPLLLRRSLTLAVIGFAAGILLYYLLFPALFIIGGIAILVGLIDLGSVGSELMNSESSDHSHGELMHGPQGFGLYVDGYRVDGGDDP